MVRPTSAKTRKHALLIFLFITVSGLIYYLLNNAYSSWAYSGASYSVIPALFIYYFATQPIYVIFLWLMRDKWGHRGLIAAILIMVATDLMSLPHSVPSLWPGQTAILPNDPNISPYADWQLIHSFSANGVATFWTVFSVTVLIPILLNTIAYLIVHPRRYQDLIARA